MEKSFAVKTIGPHQYEVGITVPDFLGLLSVLTGLFASHAISITSGTIRTEAGTAMDVFYVHAASPPDWGELERDLWDYLEKVRWKKMAEVRSAIHRRIIGFLRARKDIYSTKLYPIKLSVDQDSSVEETIIDIHVQDTPAFLYELTNALSLLGINIVRMQVETVREQVRDRLWVTTADGKKITDERQLKALQWAILLVKQFTHLLPRVPDPEAALEQMTAFGKDMFERGDFNAIVLALKKSDALSDLSKVFGTSRFLWEEFVRNQHESIFPLLSNRKLLRRKKSREFMKKELLRYLEWKEDFAGKVELINQFKDREMFRIDLRHILGKASYLGEFASEFTDLVETVVDVTYHLVLGEILKTRPRPMVSAAEPSAGAVFALGKFGGRELGYASDLELLFVYTDDPAPASPRSQKNFEFYRDLVLLFRKSVHARSEGVFEIDLRLRPHGEDGPLAVSFESFKKYYQPGGGAWDFERQALLKLRWVAGSYRLGAEVLKLRDGFVFGEQPFNFEEILRLRQRQRTELVKEGLVNVKLSAGGLLDAEYLVQALQIAYGRRFGGDVRDPNTLKAIRGLWRAGAITEKEFETCRACYVFLRSLINALRIARGNAKDLNIPKPDAREFVVLARRMGYSGDDETVRIKFKTDCERSMVAAAGLFESLIGRLRACDWSQIPGTAVAPPPELRVGLDNLLRGDLEREEKNILAAIGFRDLAGLAARFRQMCPRTFSFQAFAQVIDHTWALWAKVPDPDMAAKHLAQFASAFTEEEPFWEILAESEKAMGALLWIFGASPYLSNWLIFNPGNWEMVRDEENFSLRKTAAVLKEYEKKPVGLETLRLIRHRETLRIAMAEFYRAAPVDAVFRAFSDLCEFCLEKVYQALFKKDEMCVIALGKLGGWELNFSSDVDLMFLASGAAGGEADHAIRQYLQVLQKGGPDEFLYRADMRLRPHGNDGALYLSGEDYLHYYKNQADTWEFQALLKARPVAGARPAGEALLKELDGYIYRPQWRPEEIERLREIKRRYEAETEAKGESQTNIKLGPGGIRDVEFTAQMIQMLNAARLPGLKGPNTLEALSAIEKEKLLGAEECAFLRDAYVFLRRIENRIHLYENRQVFNIPADKPRLRALARSMGFGGTENETAEDAFGLRLSEVRQRCRSIFERVFYGK